MRLHYTLLAFVVLCTSSISFASGVFGPKESKVIFDGSRTSVQYQIENTDTKMPWLVQSWVEDSKEQKTSRFTTAPLLFRVEPSSLFSIRVIKNGDVPNDRESIYWLVSNSIPGGEVNKQEPIDGKINAKISLAYRYKIPMIYRPATLKNEKQSPESLDWSISKSGNIEVYNPTPFAVQLNYIEIQGKRESGDGVSYIIEPMKRASIMIRSKQGEKIKYSIVNDYGAVKEYDGMVR